MEINKFLFGNKKNTESSPKREFQQHKVKRIQISIYTFPVYSSLPGLGREELIIAYRTKLIQL